MKYLSVCSGIEAASVAWSPLGFEPVAFSEIEPFPCAVLKHHYPTVPNWGDLTKFREWPDATFDVLVGGTPCQSFSVAGLRKGLADPRGNLALTFLAAVDRYRPRWVVWENVPGVLSSVSHDAPDPSEPPPPLDLGCDGAEVDTADEYYAEESHAFGCLVAGFSKLGYFGAYGSLDAQYAGLAQRRLRVFAVFHLGGWPRAAAALFERESLCWSASPSQGARETGDIAGSISARTAGGGGLGTDFECDGGLVVRDARERERALTSSNQRIDYETETLIAETAPTLARPYIRARYRQRFERMPPQAPPITGRHGDPGNVVTGGWQVRRLTPLECERLQGFPDHYTRIPMRRTKKAPSVKRLAKYSDLFEQAEDGTWIHYAQDGPRYKALGNSMAVPVMAWIGRRIALVESIDQADTLPQRGSVA